MIEDVVYKWDIIERCYKPDHSEQPSQVQLSIDVLVQGSVVADLIDEVVARCEISEILDQQESFVDPAVW